MQRACRELAERTKRIWWAPILSRGKLHVELLPENFPGDDPAGTADFVARVRAGLNIRFQGTATPPTTLFVDRGAGFYYTHNGKVTPEFKAALAQHGLKAFMKDDASKQPGKLSDMLLHETCVAWIRNLDTRSQPRKPWEETREAYFTRLKGIVAKINNEFRVEKLNRELPARLELLHKKKGGKLEK